MVDAKTPLDGYLQAIEATDDADPQRAPGRSRPPGARAHDALAANRIGTSSTRRRSSPCFPARRVLLQRRPGERPGLIEFGVEQNIILATPTTLIALLRAVAYGWRQEKLAQNAAEISALGKELFKRLSDMGDHLNKWAQSGARGGGLQQRRGSMESRVMVSARSSPT